MMSRQSVTMEIAKLVDERLLLKQKNRLLSANIAALRASLRFFTDADNTDGRQGTIAPSSQGYAVPTSPFPTTGTTGAAGTVAKILARHGVEYRPEYETSPPRSFVGMTTDQYCDMMNDWNEVACPQDKL